MIGIDQVLIKSLNARFAWMKCDLLQKYFNVAMVMLCVRRAKTILR